MATAAHRRHWRAGRTALLTAALCRGVLAMMASLLLWSLLPVALGWHVTVVMSGSMEPALRPGDVVASRSVPARQVRPGQVLLVDDPDHAGRLRLHRLATIRPDGALVLRGDANRADDSTPVRRDAVRGVGTLRVPFAGSPAYWLRTHQVGPLAGGAVILLLLLGGACAWRDEDDRSPDDVDDDDHVDDADGTTGPGEGPDAEAEAEGKDAEIRRAAFARRPVRLAMIGAATLVLAVIAAGAPALAAPFRGTTGNPASTWAAATAFPSPCQDAVRADAPYLYYPLEETTGTVAADASGNQRNGTYSSTGVSHGEPGPCPTGAASATTLSGAGMISTSQRIGAPGPATFTEEIWFRTTDYRGGSLIAYANTQTTTPSQYDRQLYLDNSAHVLFGVYTGSVTTIAGSRQYNDGAWHLATATLSAEGMKLYVDAVLVASNSLVRTAENAAGYWRIGKSNFSGWTSPPTSQGLIGSISGAAIYPTALSPAQILAHYNAR